MRWIVVLVLAFSLVACGDSGDDDEPEDSGSQTTAVATEADQASEPTATEVDEAEPTEAVEPEPTVTEAAPEPTATLAPTNTPAATATPTVEPTATPQPEEADVVAGKWMLEDTTFGSMYFMGEAVNQGTGMAMQVEVIVTLRDAANTVVASQTAYVSGFIPAGELRPFKGIFSNVDPATIASQDIQIQYESFDPDSFYADLYTIDFTIIQPQWTADHVTGEVQNVGETAAEFVQIVAIGYDAAGEVMSVESTYSQLDRLDPGQSSPFDIALFSGKDVPASYQMFANGNIAD